MTIAEKTILFAGERALPQAALEVISKSGLHLSKIKQQTDIHAVVQKRQPLCLLLDYSWLLSWHQICGGNGHSGHLPESSYRVVLVNAGQLAQLHHYLEARLIHDYLVTPVNKGQMVCLLDKAQRHYAANRLFEEISLEGLVEKKLHCVMEKLAHGRVEGLHPLIMLQVERPLIKMVMTKTAGNQLKAAKMLGINRNTLRKRLSELKII